MKAIRLVGAAVLAAGAVVAIQASGPIAVYARVDKVVIDPPEAPATIQIWGVFSAAKPQPVNEYLPASRGYLYYKLPSNREYRKVALVEWNDLKALAGSKDVVAFGSQFVGAPRVRQANERPQSPDEVLVERRDPEDVGSEQRAAGARNSRLQAVTALAFAIVVWWSSNTIAHLFIHRPFFRRRTANRLFALGMSLALGIPQTLWRDRHLAHHAGVVPRLRLSNDLILQILVVVAVWTMLLDRAPLFFATVYVPGYLGGLLLCALHGHYEHAGGTVSYYGRLYNLLLFNDGYHVEHHANPGLRWSRLPERRDPQARASAWPAPLRWVERAVACGLESLERLVLRSPALQRFVLRVHERALRELIAGVPRLRHIVIVGGGLFPRTALILQSLVPHARITIVDSNRANLDRARARLTDVTFIHARYPVSDCGRTEVRHVSDPDLVIVPLCFDGDREAIYGRPPAPAVIVHDWIWHKRGISRVVSVALLKRVNLLTGAAGV